MCVCACVCVGVGVCMRACARACACVRAYVHACVHARVCLCLPIRIQTQVLGQPDDAYGIETEGCSRRNQQSSLVTGIRGNLLQIKETSVSQACRTDFVRSSGHYRVIQDS